MLLTRIIYKKWRSSVLIVSEVDEHTSWKSSGGAAIDFCSSRYWAHVVHISFLLSVSPGAPMPMMRLKHSSASLHTEHRKLTAWSKRNIAVLFPWFRPKWGQTLWALFSGRHMVGCKLVKWYFVITFWCTWSVWFGICPAEVEGEALLRVCQWRSRSTIQFCCRRLQYMSQLTLQFVPAHLLRLAWWCHRPASGMANFWAFPINTCMINDLFKSQSTVFLDHIT